MRLAARDGLSADYDRRNRRGSLIVLLGVALAFALTRRGGARPESFPAAKSWTLDAGEEFSTLGEPERCDLVFALAAFGDERSRALLERALGDPSEAVCLAAARALAKRRPTRTRSRGIFKRIRASARDASHKRWNCLRSAATASC